MNKILMSIICNEKHRCLCSICGKIRCSERQCKNCKEIKVSSSTITCDDFKK